MAENLEDIVYCFDVDETIFDQPTVWPILVDMSNDWVKEIKYTQPKLAKHLKKMGLILKGLMIGAKFGSKLMGKSAYHSGETISLRLYESLFLKDAEITEDFINRYAIKLAKSGRLNKFFTEYAIKAESERKRIATLVESESWYDLVIANSSKSESEIKKLVTLVDSESWYDLVIELAMKKLVIITSEPTQLIIKLLEAAGINEIPVYGNNFSIDKKGVVVGFESSLGGKDKKDKGVLRALEDSGASIAYLLDDNAAVVLNIEYAKAFSLSENKLKIDRLLTKLRFKNSITYVDTVEEFLTDY